MTKRMNRILAIVAFPLFFAAIAVTLILFGDRLAPFFRDREALRTWIEARGTLGPLLFYLLQILQVVIFILPGEIVQVGGGFAFGFWPGLGLSLAGIGTGSILNYFVGRALGRPFVEAVFPKDSIKQVESVVSSRKAILGYFLLFVIPGIPKDVLCYVAGMSKFPVLLFVAASMTGRIPGIAGSSLIGSSAYQGNLALSLGLFAAAGLAFVSGLLFRARISAWLDSRFGTR